MSADIESAEAFWLRVGDPRADRIEAITARERAIRAEIVELLPRCRHHEGVGLKDLKMCRRVATKEGTWPDCEAVYCDEHAGGPCDCDDEPGDDLPWAHIIRALGSEN